MEAPFVKGQLHAHSGNSGDSQTAPREVLRWYGEHGFDFVVFTDHNFVTVLPDEFGVLAIPGVELTHNSRTCKPAPARGHHCLLHVNALFVDPSRAGPVSMRPTANDRLSIFRESLRWSDAAGGIAQLNHPNFHFSASAELIAKLARDRLLFVEIANEAWDSNNAGDDRHPSTEQLWDEVLSLGVPVSGVATDDAHHYYDAKRLSAEGKRPFSGNRGFVMVRARKDAASIREALRRGEFYSSTGLLLDQAELSEGELRVRIAEPSSPPHRITVLGRGGRVVHEAQGSELRFPLSKAPRGYLRAVARDGRGKKAWTQPIPVP